MTYTMTLSKAIGIEEAVLSSLGCDEIHVGRLEDDGTVGVDIHMINPTQERIRALNDYLSHI